MAKAGPMRIFSAVVEMPYLPRAGTRVSRVCVVEVLLLVVGVGVGVGVGFGVVGGSCARVCVCVRVCVC